MKQDLARGSCTHLIALSTDTEKFKAAAKWGPEHVKVVSKGWLDACLAAGGAAPTRH